MSTKSRERRVDMRHNSILESQGAKSATIVDSRTIINYAFISPKKKRMV